MPVSSADATRTATAAPADAKPLAAPALRAGWTAVTDEEGDTYYFNAASGESQWEAPFDSTHAVADV